MKQTKTPDQFKELTLIELHQLWFNQALTDRQIAKMYGVDAREVKDKRKEFKLNWFSAATMYITGGNRYKNDKNKVK